MRMRCTKLQDAEKTCEVISLLVFLKFAGSSDPEIVQECLLTTAIIAAVLSTLLQKSTKAWKNLLNV